MYLYIYGKYVQGRIQGGGTGASATPIEKKHTFLSYCCFFGGGGAISILYSFSHKVPRPIHGGSALEYLMIILNHILPFSKVFIENQFVY